MKSKVSVVTRRGNWKRKGYGATKKKRNPKVNVSKQFKEMMFGKPSLSKSLKGMWARPTIWTKTSEGVDGQFGNTKVKIVKSPHLLQGKKYYRTYPYNHGTPAVFTLEEAKRNASKVYGKRKK